MEGFTKEVLMMWREVLAVEGKRCIAPRVGRRGIQNELHLQHKLSVSNCKSTACYRMLEGNMQTKGYGQVFFFFFSMLIPLQ